MSTENRSPLVKFLLHSKPGRMLIFTGFLGLLCFVVPYGCSKRKSIDDAAPSNPSGKPGQEADLPPSPQGIGETITLGQKYDALISRWGGDLSSAKVDLDTTRKELEALRSQIKDERSAQDKEKKDLEGTIRKLKDGLIQSVPPPANPPPAANPDAGNRPPAPDGTQGGGGLRAIDLGTVSPKEKKDVRRTVRIPTAAGGRATLLNGVFAPVTGEPGPVRLRFDAAILGPNQARIPLKNSYLIGKATGDANSCRVSIQIEKFSTVKEKGEAIETKAIGYVVGDDGLEGVPGSYEWRAWEYMPLAVGTGGLQGISGALAQTQMTTTVNPLGGVSNAVTGDSMKLAGYQALGGASGKLSEIVAERMKEIRPAVSTPANRQVTVVFLDGVTLEGLDTQEIDYAKENDPYHGLDSHR
ncbi:MAG TPA: TraB/VirB10 family protein [Planctomycetota bacterium]|nr:TraB/VirB10 family protein [Planctomycetota bacterium]